MARETKKERELNNKVYKIIEEELDQRAGLAVIQYLCYDIGIEKAKSVTDEDIEAMEDNGFMTHRFQVAFMKTARRIALECNFIDDIVSYLIRTWGHLGK